MAHTIEIDDEVFEFLKQRAEPFIDTPNSVLRRLLEIDATQRQVSGSTSTSAESRRPKKKRNKVKQRTRVPAGSILPEEEYEVPLLRALVDAGGSGASREITTAVGEYLDPKLTDLDRQQLKSGGIRWENRIQFVRLKMIERGYMQKDAPRGTWAITDAGRRFLDGIR